MQHINWHYSSHENEAKTNDTVFLKHIYNNLQHPQTYTHITHS